MPEFANFTPPEPQDEGDRFDPREAIDHLLVIRPIEHKTGIITTNAPNGTDAVSADVLDLDHTGGPKVYNDTLLFTGALVDGLKPFVGQVVVIRLEMRKSKSGRTYPSPIASRDGDQQRAQDYWTKNGDPFIPALQTVSQAPF